MPCDHERIRSWELYTSASSCACKLHSASIFSCQIIKRDVPVTSRSDLVPALGKAEAVYATLDVNLVLSHGRPHCIDVELIMVVAGGHLSTAVRELDLSHL